MGPSVDLEQTISELHTTALASLEAATTAEGLEAVRIEALGRKGKLAEISKSFGKLSADDRARIGKLLNSVKQDLESRLDARKSALDSLALDSRLDSEWIDLTAPAP